MKYFYESNKLFTWLVASAVALTVLVIIIFSKEDWTGSRVYSGIAKLKEFIDLLGANTLLNYLIVGILIFLSVIVLAVFFTKLAASNSELSDVKKVSIVGVFSGLAFIFMFFGIPFILPFLKIEVSVVIILLVMSFVDFKSGVMIALIIAVLDFIVKGSAVGYPIDQFAYFIAAFFFITPVYFITRNNNSNKRLLVGLIVSTLVTTVIMILLNYIWILPVYIKLYGLDSITDYANAVAVNTESANKEFMWIAVTFGTFNVVKWGIVAIVGYISLKATKPLIKILSK